METNGNLSVFPYPQHLPASAKNAGIQVKKQYLPVTIIADGALLKDNLAVARKTEKWVAGILKEHDADRKDTLLLTVDEADHVLFLRKEDTP